MKHKIKETIDIQEAMDNLTAIVGIDMNHPPALGITKGRKFVTTEEEFGPETVEWLSSEGIDPILEILNLTYRAIYQHLVKLYADPEKAEDEKSRKGMRAMILLVGESAEKMEQYLGFKLGEKLPFSIKDQEEFRLLQKFYSDLLAPQFSKEVQESDVPQTALKDFQTVLSDIEYELFYIRNEEGKPYFNKELLRNIKLNCDFDLDAEGFEEDPFLKTRSMLDRDLNASAHQILKACEGVLKEYYKQARKKEESDFSNFLGMALIALHLAANPRHLVQNTNGKSCFQYFQDFQMFLRSAMQTMEYQKLIAYPPERSDPLSLFLDLSHLLARNLFERGGGVRLETIGLIHRAMRKGEEMKQKEKKPLLKGENVWDQFLLDDEKYRTLLSKFPNGPLFKILDLIREENEEALMIPFDPILQENLPSKIYELEYKGKKIKFLRMACPTRQIMIHKAEVIEEFLAFLRSFAQEKKGEKHLIIHLQDRTSWKEYARCKSLENLQMNAEFNHQLVVLTLPKATDFYHQNQEYLNFNGASDFIKAFSEQLHSAEECGYFFPSLLKKTEESRFIETAMHAIHKYFFHSKNTLTRRNREDFIEIFYQFLILKAIDKVDPSSVSFTCKDGIDTGSASSAMFYGFLKLFQEDFPKKEEAEFLRWLLYAPALLIRERAIHPECLHRSLSALACMQAEFSERREEICKVFAPFYTPQIFQRLAVHPIQSFSH